MKKLILFIILIMPFVTKGQSPLQRSNYGTPNGYSKMQGATMFDTIVAWPVRDTIGWHDEDFRKQGRFTIRPQDSLPYYNNGSYWSQVIDARHLPAGNGNGDVTTSQLADSLKKYLQRGDSVNTYVTLKRLKDSIAALENRILAKGYLTTEVDGSVTNELQTLSLPDSQHLAISNGNNVAVPWLSEETDPTVDGKITDAFNTLGIPLYRVTATGDSTADSIILKNGYRIPIPSGFYSSIRSAYNITGLNDSLRLMFCVLRPNFSGPGNLTTSWSVLSTVDGHTSLHIDSVKAVGSMLYIYFPTVKYMGYASATVDNDLANIVHAQCGAKGNLDNIIVEGSVPAGTKQGYFIMPSGSLTTYGLDFVTIDTSVTASGYSFKVTTPAADNSNRFVPNGNYAGANTARVSAYYAGANSYHIHKIDDKWNPTFVILDMYGNTVPLKSLDANDKIIVDTGMPITFALGWDYNNNGFFATTSAIWVSAWVKL